MASNRSPGNIYSEQVGVNGFGQGPLRGVNYSSGNINLRNSGSNANGVEPGLAVYTTMGQGVLPSMGGYWDNRGAHSQPGGAWGPRCYQR